jgi:citrate lyase gamma subunit
MRASVGSIESSDLKIEIHDDSQSVQIKNMVSELEDSLVTEIIMEILERTGIAAYRPIVYFNGANRWVIESRCEALLSLLKSEHIPLLKGKDTK